MSLFPKKKWSIPLTTSAKLECSKYAKKDVCF